MLLQTTGFFLWGLLWAVFFTTDGFDFGIGTLYPFLGKTEPDKRAMLKTIGPLWDGNEVWLVTAGGVTFAAFPHVYAVMFSSFYSALMLILFALIFRGLCFEFRSQVDHPLWYKIWDTCFFVGSVVPAFLFGLAFANIFKGIPIDQNGIYHGTLWTLFNSYGLLGGMLFLLLFAQHGAIWLLIKTEENLQERALRAANGLWPVLSIFLVVFLIVTKVTTTLYDNYFAHPALFSVILTTGTALLGIKVFMKKKAWFRTWFSSALTIIGITFFGIIGLYPTMFPSSMNNSYSLTAHNAASSPLTLKIMLFVVAIFIPIVIAYQTWVYALFRGKETKKDLAPGPGYS